MAVALTARSDSRMEETMAVEEKVRADSSTPKIAQDVGIVDTEALREEIAVRAYYKFCERGCTPGSAVEDWLVAEREVLSEHATPAASARAFANDRDRKR